MNIRIKEVINNLKNYDFDILGNYKMDGAEAKKLIEAIEETDKKIADYTYTIGLLQDRLDEIEKSNKWIPCKASLPEFGEDVLITNGIIVTKGWIDDDDHKWRLNDNYIVDSVIAWMPLPQPYKAETTIERGLAYADKNTQNGWIMCNDRLPELDTRVLVVFESELGCEVVITTYDRHGFWASPAVIAWQPLPKWEVEK